MKSNETYDVGFYDMIPYIILGTVFAVITIVTLFSTSVSNKKNNVKNIPSLFVIIDGSAEMYSNYNPEETYIPQKNYVKRNNSANIFLSRDNTITSETLENFNYFSLEFNKILKSTNTEKKETSLKTEKTANASAKQKSVKKVASKKHTETYSEGEVKLMANAIYRECGGYYLNSKSYGLTKTQGLRAAIITGVVMRNRRDTVKDYKSITDVLTAPHQYGKGGQDSLNRINHYHAPQVFKRISKAILNYKEVEIAKKLVGNENDFNVKDFQVPKSVYYQSQYSTLGSEKYAQIGNQIYNFK